jgi:hypothetical protein
MLASTSTPRLDTIKALPCRVMISGYWTKLYAAALQAQRSMSIRAGGIRPEGGFFRRFSGNFRQNASFCRKLGRPVAPRPREQSRVY